MVMVLYLSAAIDVEKILRIVKVMSKVDNVFMTSSNGVPDVVSFFSIMKVVVIEAVWALTVILPGYPFFSRPHLWTRQH